MQSILLIIHILMALVLIGLILIQHGKGADAGAAFGSGASSTVFGSTGSTSFLVRATGLLALVFFANSFFLSYLSTTGAHKEGLMEKVQVSDSDKSNSKEVDTKKLKPQQKTDHPVPAEQTGQSDLPVVPE